MASKTIDTRDMQERRDRLEEILDEMKDLVAEAGRMVRGTPAASRAEAYWIAQVRCALDEDHSYLGGSMCTMADTVEELDELTQDDSGETEPPRMSL